MEINILLIEDNIGDQRLFEEMIIDSNLQLQSKIKPFYQTKLESQLDHYLEENKIDIVFLDLGLPGSSGEETLLEFKKFNTNIPVVAYTGANDITLGSQLLKDGADDYICKSDVTPSLLVKTILLNLERKQLKQKLIDQEKMLIAQSRSAAMGDMIGIIAHQWKQPLSSLSMIANNILLDIDLGNSNTTQLRQDAQDILHQINYLAQTINDFKDFFKPNKEKQYVSVETIIDDTIKLIDKSLTNNSITIVKNYANIGKFYLFANELSQVLINLIKNAKEILLQRDVPNKQITIETKIDKFIHIDIEDNAGGIDSQVITKIFEPYFSTKEKLNGTGLGLYISKTIIEEHFKGSLSASNTQSGAKFSIKLPLS